MAYSPNRTPVLLSTVEPVTGDPERDVFLAALHAIEARLGERHGWDQSPRLLALYLADVDTRAVGVDVIAARHWRRGHANPADDLTATALRFPEPDRDNPRPLPFADRPGGAAGVAFLFEGWSVADSAEVGPAEQARRAAGERTFAVRPDRVEVRHVFAVDVNGYPYALRRPRDGQVDAAVDGADARGQVPGSLSRLAWAMRDGTWPPRSP